MGTAALGETPRRRLEHEPHRCADAPQFQDVFGTHDARVQVRQQPGFVEHRFGRTREVLERRLATERGELVTGGAVPQLRLVAQREQCLAATGRGPGAGNGEDLVDGHVRALAAARGLRERAVVADVATQLRQRDEDLRRVRDDAPLPLVPEHTSLSAQILQRPPKQLHQGSLRSGRIARRPSEASR